MGRTDPMDRLHNSRITRISFVLPGYYGVSEHNVSLDEFTGNVNSIVYFDGAAVSTWRPCRRKMNVVCCLAVSCYRAYAQIRHFPFPIHISDHFIFSHFALVCFWHICDCFGCVDSTAGHRLQARRWKVQFNGGGDAVVACWLSSNQTSLCPWWRSQCRRQSLICVTAFHLSATDRKHIDLPSSPLNFSLISQQTRNHGSWMNHGIMEFTNACEIVSSTWNNFFFFLMHVFRVHWTVQQLNDLHSTFQLHKMSNPAAVGFYRCYFTS